MVKRTCSVPVLDAERCEGSNAEGFISTVQTWTQSQRLAAAREVTLIPAFHFGAFLREQLWTCHMLKVWQAIDGRPAVYVRPVHSFLSHLHTPFIKDSLLLSECLASLSWVFIREFNRQASFTKTPYKKNLENASLCLQKYAWLTVWPCGIKNEWTKALIL